MTLTLAVRVQLPLRWNTYFLFDEGEAESIVLLNFFTWRYLNRRWMRGCEVGQKSFLGPAEIASFSCREFSRSNKDDTFWDVVSTGYFYVLFSWTIAVSGFRPLEIYQNLGLSLSSVTFTVNSRADYHFYKYIYLFQILYSMKSVFFLLKCWLRFWPKFIIFRSWGTDSGTGVFL